MAMSLSKAMIIERICLVLALWHGALGTTTSALRGAKESLEKAVTRLNHSIEIGDIECTSCGDPSDTTCFLNKLTLLQTDIQSALSSCESLNSDVSASCSACQYQPSIYAEPGFVIADTDKPELFTVDTSQSRTGSVIPTDKVRAFFYDKGLAKIFTFSRVLRTYNLDMSGGEVVIGSDFKGMPRWDMDGDPYKGFLYVSISSNIRKYSYDGTLVSTLATGTQPRGIKMDTCNGLLYWGDIDQIKIVNVEGTPVISTINVTAGEQVSGLDIDFTQQKAYFCTIRFGKLFVLDLATNVTTELVGNEGNGPCYSLRFYNNFLYMTYSLSTNIVKRDLSGNFVSNVLSGVFANSTVKFFDILA